MLRRGLRLSRKPRHTFGLYPFPPPTSQSHKTSPQGLCLPGHLSAGNGQRALREGYGHLFLLLTLRNELSPLRIAPYTPRSMAPYLPGLRSPSPLACPLLHLLPEGPPCFTGMESGEGTIPFELFCFPFCDTVYLSWSLSSLTEPDPLVPASCSPFSVPNPSLAAQSFPESLQGLCSERSFWNHSPGEPLVFPKPPVS